jgi:hypothetical protein
MAVTNTFLICTVKRSNKQKKGKMKSIKKQSKLSMALLLLTKEQSDFAIESANKLSQLLGFENVAQIQKLTNNPLATLKFYSLFIGR